VADKKFKRQFWHSLECDCAPYWREEQNVLLSKGKQQFLCLSCMCVVLIKISHLSFTFCVIYLLWHFHSKTTPHFPFLLVLSSVAFRVLKSSSLSSSSTCARSFSPKSTKHVTGISIKFSQDELSFLRFCGLCSLSLTQASLEFLIYFASEIFMFCS
jgi:hypothetical protein